MRGYPPDYEVDGQMSLFDDAKARVKPGQRFVSGGVEYEIVSVDKDNALIKRVDKGLTFLHGVDALVRTIGIKWREQ